MFFKQFILEDLGCASYMIGDIDAGECAVVDPRWDVTEYLDVAQEKGMRVRYVIETHNHADHVSGHGKLAAQGAQVAIHEEAGVEYEHSSLKDGDTLEVGKVRVTVLHTPGHRPEHISLAVADTSRAQEPWLVLTGDCLFVGDVGRPDLAVQPKEGAVQLYASLQEKLLRLEDGVEIYPAHVSGSLCGKGMSPKGNSTIGFERRYNPPLLISQLASFVAQVTDELPPQPPHFQKIVEKNRGPFLTEEISARPLSAEEVARMQREGAQLLDTRSPEAFGGGHIPGALNVHLHGGQFATRASWVMESGRPVVLILEENDDLEKALANLAAAGQEGIEGYLLGGAQSWEQGGRHIERVGQITIAELQELIESGDRRLQVIDVREPSEWREGHIPGAINIPFHRLAAHVDEVPGHRSLATVCGGGARSSIAASILKARNLEPVNVLGGMDAWSEAKYPVEGEG